MQNHVYDQIFMQFGAAPNKNLDPMNLDVVSKVLEKLLLCSVPILVYCIIQ